jgi:hypothetical protein
MTTSVRRSKEGVVMKKLQLKRGEIVVAVVPKVIHGPGPGGRNEPTFVYILTPTGRIREDCIQPDDAPLSFYKLSHPAAAIHDALLKALPVEYVD